MIIKLLLFFNFCTYFERDLFCPQLRSFIYSRSEGSIRESLIIGNSRDTDACY